MARKGVGARKVVVSRKAAVIVKRVALRQEAVVRRRRVIGESRMLKGRARAIERLRKETPDVVMLIDKNSLTIEQRVSTLLP